MYGILRKIDEIEYCPDSTGQLHRKSSVWKWEIDNKPKKDPTNVIMLSTGKLRKPSDAFGKVSCVVIWW